MCGKHDLMMFRNPHGCTEFKGAWRDGSKEWSQNPSAAKELNYVPDPNDGLFWMAKDDAFRYFQTFYALLKPMQGEMAAKKVVEQGSQAKRPVSEIKKANLEIKKAVSAGLCGRASPAHMRRDSRTSALELTPTSAPGTRAHLRRDLPAHLRRDWSTSALGLARR